MSIRSTAWHAIPVLLLVLGACSNTPAAPAAGPGPAEPAPATSPSGGSPPTSPSTPTTQAPATTSSTVPAFAGAALRVTAADLPASWRPGCPVAPADLRKLELSYWGFDGQPHTGALVVAATEADAVIDVFRRLYDRRFPIRRMEPIDVYGGS
ncbi:MAG: M15 family peptidase, partial [Actinomycetota bacterium]|nr:M15 family peptidase [Actinomycetota bacterium]